MEDGANWVHHGFGEMAFVDERVREGNKSLRLTSPTKGNKPGGVTGRPFGASAAVRKVDHEDWRDWNRLSFWVYPNLPGFKVVSLCLVLHNDGTEKVPGPYGRNGRNFVLLKNHQWNHIFWEIQHLGRDKVTGVEFCYRLQGNEPGATGTVTYYFDELELQKVQSDHYEGWDVAPGEIAYCHTGYPMGFSKTALAGDLSAQEFVLVDAQNGREVFRERINNVTTHLGRFQIMNFTKFDREGEYVLRAGGRKSKPFRIAGNVWRATIIKTINHFYCQRCGYAVEGIHDVCHRDWMCVHADKKITINGGWHDAGDLSQGLVNTSEAVYAMFALAHRLAESDPILSSRLIEEAKWGLDWVLKTRFGDGFRCTWATMDFWTDGKSGNVDDVTSKARNRPFENFLAASAEAIGARMLTDSDRARASDCMKAAKEDWQFAIHQVTEGRTLNLELAGAALNASIDLYEATKEGKYADAAVNFAEFVVDCQQQTNLDGDVPLRGFFYTRPDKKRILHYSHRGHEQGPIVGLVRMCGLFSGHEDFERWHKAIKLYTQHYKTIRSYTEPYCMIPAGVYDLRESSDVNYLAQVKNGVRLNDRHYLRRFPVWTAFRGNHGTVLSQAKGLATAARYLKDKELLDLCQKQLQWVLGLNPFCQSTMYGEGHDFAPQYTAMSGDMVGSLPVGVQTHFNRDEPYWPAENCYNWKEVWVHPSSRWLWLMCDLYSQN
jgi:hypothetical protein